MYFKRLGFPRFGYLGHLAHLHSDMDTLFDALTRRVTGESMAGVFPPINVAQTRDGFLVRAELPGMKADELGVSAKKNKLSISGERKLENDDSASYHRRERTGGKFSRSVTLPADIDAKRVDASYKDGILTITLPLAAEARPRIVAVKTS
jgi:HSP20 family protein